MFSGIIDAIGRVKRPGEQLEIQVPNGYAQDLALGDSVAVDGVCLTVEKKALNLLQFFVTKHTLKTTILGAMSAGTLVNLEKALVFGGRVNGHLVSGHVDEIGWIDQVRVLGTGQIYFVVEISKPGNVVVVEKGSVAINGISLTIADLKIRTHTLRMGFAITRPTLDATTIGTWSKGGKVNVEFDMVGKHQAAELKKKSRERTSLPFDVVRED